jgi:hypothetical protein
MSENGLDDFRSFDEINKVWDAWAPKAPRRRGAFGEGRMARLRMLVELNVTAAV